MALKKAIEDSMGVPFEYWRVLPQIAVDYVEGSARAHAVPWVNEAARQANKRPGHVHELISPEDMRVLEEALFLQMTPEELGKELKKGDLRDAFYARLKTLKLFEGAEDV